MRELVFTCAMAFLGGGCVNVVSHFSEYDAAPDVKPSEGGTDAGEGGPPLVCASGTFWTGGNAANAVMSPGRPCNGGGCHSSNSKTVITFGGTIYAGERDVDDCNGVNGSGYAVVPIDDMGNELIPRLFVNAAGNFYTSKVIPTTPYRVKVIRGGKETIKKIPISDGNCNYCHTAEGQMQAKGRIAVP